MEYKIIDFVRENPFLYDKTLKSFRNMNAKEKKWEEFADSIGEPVRKLKTRWRTLRDRFHREKKKLSEPSGSGSCSPILRWKYYDKLDFLNNYATTNLKTSSPQCSRFAASLENEDFEFNDTAEYFTTFQAIDDDNLEGYIDETSEADDFKSTIIKKSSRTRVKPHLSSQNNSQCSRISSSFDKKQSKDVYVVLPSQNNDAQLEKASKNMTELFDLAKSSFKDAAPTPASLFFHSIAVQVEKENLSFERFSALQLKVLKALQEEVSLNKKNIKNKVSNF